MDLPNGTGAPNVEEAHASADCGGVLDRTLEPNAQAGFGAEVVVKLRVAGVLRDHQIDAPIVVVVSQRAASLFAVNFDARNASRDGDKATAPISFEPKAAPR